MNQCIQNGSLVLLEHQERGVLAQRVAQSSFPNVNKLISDVEATVLGVHVQRVPF